MATVDQIITDNLNFVDDKQNDMASFVNEISDAAFTNFLADVYDVGAGYIPVESDIEAINNLVGSFPSVPAIVIPSYAPPELADISIDDVEHDITVLEAARAMLLGDLQDGGYGIDTDDESALLDRTRDRTAMEATRATEEVERVYTNRRFPTPPGALFDAQERIRQTERSALSEVNRDIFIRRSEQFFQARQFAIQTAGTLDKLRADILEIQFRIQETRARFALAAFQSQLDSYRIRISAAIDQAKLTLDRYQIQSGVTSDRVRLAAETAKIRIGEYQANYTSLLGVLDYNLKQSLAEIDAIKQQADLRLKAATAGADFYASIVSGALSAVNTVVSQTTEEASESS
jgi:hypothetical protein